MKYKLSLVIILSVANGLLFTSINNQGLNLSIFYILVPIIPSLIMALIQESLLKLFKKNYPITKQKYFRAFFNYWVVWIILCGISTFGAFYIS